MRFRLHLFQTLMFILIAALGVERFAVAADDLQSSDLTDEHVRKAIDAIVLELYDRKSPTRFWEPSSAPSGESTKQTGGYTALTVLSLLTAGETYQDPRLRDAVEYLEKCEMEGTYAVCMRTAVWAQLPPRFDQLLRKDVQWLLDGYSQQAGGWTYEQKPNTTRKDNSIRQFGALALWEASKRGVPIPPGIWRGLEDAFLDGQLPDGGWNYKADQSEATGSMTAAGLATLFITQDLLHTDESIRLGSREAARHESAIARGLAWMDQQFRPDDNPGSFRDYYYYLYGVERIGLASGVKYFGEHDWYREGAAELLRRLCSWDETARTMTVNLRIGGGNSGAFVQVRHLTFGLLFLSRGRVPVAVNKLRVPDLAWNNRPRDVANFTSWLTGATEADLSWQIVDFTSDPDQWLDAPMLYFASDQRLPWLKDVEMNERVLKRDVRDFLARRAAGEVAMDAHPPAIPSTPELRKLKRYLDRGGMLLAVNEGSTRNFAQSVQDLGTLLYPQYDWRTLPPDHWAFALHIPVQGRRPSLLGLSNGVRELIIIAPRGDLSATLQKRDTTARGGLEIYQTIGNIYFYASEMNRPRPRLARHGSNQPSATPPVSSAGRAKDVTIVRAIHGGNWKPEPYALDAFRDWIEPERNLKVRLIDHPLHLIHELDPLPQLVIASGIDAHEFTPAQKQAIKQCVERGGRILFESPGGNGAFVLSAEEMAMTMFDDPIRAVHRDPAMTGAGIDGAEDLSRVEYRPFALETFGSRETTPRLRGITVGGKTPILFSREDISHALLDQPCWGVAGYAPDSARRMLANTLLEAMSSNE